MAKVNNGYRVNKENERLGESESSGWFEAVVAILFAAVCIVIVRAASYTRNMSQFYWTNEADDLTDFFSYYKAIFIIALAIAALFMITYKLAAGQFRFRRVIYIPILVYALFVLISYALSDWKEFSLLGFNGRFEGTLTILSYLAVLILIIDGIKSEKQIKAVVIAVGVSCFLLGLLGISQGTGHDFFRTGLGKRLITPISGWNNLDSLQFTFQNNEIYQTVFNINYVSFYLALVIPVFAMLMIYALNNAFKRRRDKTGADKKKDGKGIKAGSEKEKKRKAQADTAGDKAASGKPKSDKKDANGRRPLIGFLSSPLFLSVILVLFFALLIYNLAGSKSSGGIAGLGAAFIAALILFNKRLIKWWKSVALMLAVMLVMLGVTSSVWLPELSGTVDNVTAGSQEGQQTEESSLSAVSVSISAVTGGASDAGGTETGGDSADSDEGSAPDAGGTETDSSEDGENTENTADDAESESAEGTGSELKKPYIDYIKTDGNTVYFSVNGEELTLNAVIDNENYSLNDIELYDPEGERLYVTGPDEESKYRLSDGRFSEYMMFQLVQDDSGNLYIGIITEGREWLFMVTVEGLKYRNGFGNLVDLKPVKAYGFKNNPQFGSGRGYIWSRTLGMITDNFLTGDGADTYCLYFPHYDYAGKYNSGDSYTANLDLIIDKPHNMYLGMFQGTGGISMLAFLAMMIIYLVQSVKTLRKNEYDTWLEYLCAGIFLGVIGFLVGGLFNDSSVSVMPLFYGMFGIGIAANGILKKKRGA